MSNIGYIRTAPTQRLVTVGDSSNLPRLDDPARAKLRAALREIAGATALLVGAMAVMAGFMAFRLWFLMPATLHFSG